MCSMCGIFGDAQEDEQLGEEEFRKAGLCVHMCQHKCVTHRKTLLVVDSHYSGANPEAPERPNTPAAPLSPSAINKTTQPVSL